MKDKITFSFLTLLFGIIIPQTAHAQEKLAVTSATFEEAQVTEVQDNRAQILQKFLEQYNSPLAVNAPTFVSEADKNKIDWKLLPAIAGVESTFGHAIPWYGCNNAWGYDIYGSQTRCFDSYDEAIGFISKDIRETYMNKWGDQDVYQIGQNYAASPTWSSRVSYFMGKIEDFSYQYQTQTLPLSL